jgi:hypothetical protein
VETADAALVFHNVDFVHEPVTGLALQLAGVGVGARRFGHGRHPAGVGGGDRGRAGEDLCRNQFEWRSLVAMLLSSGRVNRVDISGGPVILDVFI